MALKRLVPDFQTAGRMKKDKKNMVEVGSFWLAGRVVQSRVPDTFPPRRAALYPAVRAPSFGVRVKMRGEHCKEKTRLLTWEGGSQPLRRGLT